MTKFKTCIIVILAILLLIVSFQTIYPRFSHIMKYKAPTCSVLVQYKETDYGYSKSTIKDKLENIVGIKFYIYKEKNICSEYLGKTNFMFRTITLDKNLTNNEYIEVLCHELLHLKYNTANERFTQYQTFVYLYNSEFKQSALNIIYKLQHDYYYYEYDCYSQIIDYLS